MHPRRAPRIPPDVARLWSVTRPRPPRIGRCPCNRGRLDVRVHSGERRVFVLRFQFVRATDSPGPNPPWRATVSRTRDEIGQRYPARIRLNPDGRERRKEDQTLLRLNVHTPPICSLLLPSQTFRPVISHVSCSLTRNCEVKDLRAFASSNPIRHCQELENLTFLDARHL
jgi:hypothetical protein